MHKKGSRNAFSNSQPKKVRGAKPEDASPRSGFVLSIREVAKRLVTIESLRDRYTELTLREISALESIVLSYDIIESSGEYPSRRNDGRWYIYLDPLVPDEEQRSLFYQQLLAVNIQRDLANPKQQLIQSFNEDAPRGPSADHT
jgi:hypothetical protein